ncbi:integrase family protein [Roseovarius sp. EL26]|uniref:integrase family protein n=1 Tax=Roseovarius sp. EL26 TaxID=2126672 RepID=UPI000EA1C2F0|nr:integrase family protein [Roseovarius sp. EL26]
MATKLTQSVVDKIRHDQEAGKQIYDASVSGLRIVIGKMSASYKLVGRINDGTDRYISLLIGRTDEVSLKTARERAHELRTILRRGEDPRATKTRIPNLKEVADAYFATRGQELSTRTLAWYKQKVDGALSTLKKLPVDRIDRTTVRALHEKLTRKTGPCGANGAMRVLKLLINDAARTLDLPPNPVTRGVRMNQERPRDWAIGPDDMPSLWRQLDDLEDRVRRCCWLAMLLTGLRSKDARSMKWEHLDQDGVLTVPSPKGGEVKAFKLPLPRLLVQELGEVRDLTRPLESPFIFPSSTSNSGHIEQMCRTKGFPYAPHMMRHTYRTHAMEAGVDFQTVTLLLNHANPHVSFNYVTRAHLLGHMREAQEGVCARLSSFR